MVAAQVKSFTSEATYKLHINEHEGHAVACECKSFQFGKGRACKHMVAFDEQLQRAATFILLQRMVQEKQETAKAWREYAEMA